MVIVCWQYVQWGWCHILYNVLLMWPQLPHRWGTALAWRWGLWALRILQISLFRNPKARRLLRVLQFGPQNTAYGSAKISRNPVQSVCLQGILAVPLLASILRSWHRLRATPVVVVGPLATVPPRDHFFSPVPNGQGSYEWGSRSTLVYWLWPVTRAQSCRQA